MEDRDTFWSVRTCSPAWSFVAIALVAVGSGCGPRRKRSPPAISASPAPAAPHVHSDGALEKRADGLHYVDVARGFELKVPDGWTGVTDVPTDEEGPPAGGDVRVRLRAPALGCAIDVATLPTPTDVTRTIARGREIFFLAKTDEPAPAALTHDAVWAGTTAPAVAGKVDVGYWIAAQPLWVRVEGRFPSERFPECKAALDAVVTSMGSLDRRVPETNVPVTSRSRG